MMNLKQYYNNKDIQNIFDNLELFCSYFYIFFQGLLIVLIGIILLFLLKNAKIKLENQIDFWIIVANPNICFREHNDANRFLRSIDVFLSENNNIYNRVLTNQNEKLDICCLKNNNFFNKFFIFKWYFFIFKPYYIYKLMMKCKNNHSLAKISLQKRCTFYNIIKECEKMDKLNNVDTSYTDDIESSTLKSLENEKNYIKSSYYQIIIQCKRYRKLNIDSFKKSCDDNYYVINDNILEHLKVNFYFTLLTRIVLFILMSFIIFGLIIYKYNKKYYQLLDKLMLIYSDNPFIFNAKQEKLLKFILNIKSNHQLYLLCYKKRQSFC